MSGRNLFQLLLLALGASGIFYLYRPGQMEDILRGLQNVGRSLDIPRQSTGLSSGQDPGDWTRQYFGEVSLEAPFPLTQRTPSNQGLQPAQLRQIVQRNYWMAKSADGFQVEVVFFQIDGTHTYSLEDGAKGPVRKFAARVGDSNPAYVKADVFVDGLPARRVSYARVFGGTNLHLEELVVQANRKLMGLVVSYPGEGRNADADRVLNSMSVHSR